MNLKKALEIVESHHFSARLNIASSLSLFSKQLSKKTVFNFYYQKSRARIPDIRNLFKKFSRELENSQILKLTVDMKTHGIPLLVYICG